MFHSIFVRNPLPELRDDDQLRLVCSRPDSRINSSQHCSNLSGNDLPDTDSLAADQQLDRQSHVSSQTRISRSNAAQQFSARLGRPMGRANWLRALMVLFTICIVGSQSGCSLLVMANKMFLGDPKIKAQFKQRTGVDLIDEEKRVLVVCSTPEFLRTEHSAVGRDIIDGMYRRFRLHEIDCVNPSDVDGWLGRVGGVWDDATEIAQEFDTDYIIHIEIDEVAYLEENSPNFYRGNAHGMVSVYESRKTGSGRGAFLIFQHEYKSQYPIHYPMSSDNMSERTFAEKFNKRMADELARLFYDYRTSESVD